MCLSLGKSLRYSRLWLALTMAADCSLSLIVTELRLTIEANAMRQLVPPDAFNAVRRQRRVTRRVLEIAVPEVRLQRPRVDAVLSSLTLQTCRSICACAFDFKFGLKPRRPNGTVFPAKSNTSHFIKPPACQSWCRPEGGWNLRDAISARH